MSTPFSTLDTELPPGVTLLEASAGTGKTYTLAAIYLRLLLEHGLAVREILVTTYTIPATAELRDRIRRRLTECLSAFESGESRDAFLSGLIERHDRAQAQERLRDALRDFDEAAIHTIHGFCQRMLREATFESGTSFDFELLPDQSALLREAAEDFWRQHFASAEPVITALALLENLTPDALLTLQRAGARPELHLIPSNKHGTDKAALASLSTFRDNWHRWRDKVRAIFLVETEWAKKPFSDSDYAEPLLDLVDALASSGEAPLSAYKALECFELENVTESTRSKASPPHHAFLDWCAEFASARAEFALGVRHQWLASAPLVLRASKAARGLLAFDDLLTALRDALDGPAADALISACRFRAALVDEFQDTDATQDAIFHRLFAREGRWLMLIGDPKQAIYGFRGADIYTYLTARSTATRCYTLDTNHRSDAPLIAAVNTLFARPHLPFVEPRIAFPPVHAARSEAERPLTHSGSPRAPMRFWYWEKEKVVGVTEAASTLPPIVAAAVSRLLQSQTTLEARALQPRDCAVLCSKNDQCSAVQAALSAQGVPSVIYNASSVFASDEASELRRILEAIAQPGRESLVRAALATAVMGQSATELDALSHDTTRWETLLNRFRLHHARWTDAGFIQMFRHFLRSENVRSRLLQQPDGERRITNLTHLAELLQAASTDLHLGPPGLARWLGAQLDSPSGGEEHELRLESDANAVTILTIHKSKGLEWPVVFCPFAWSKAELRRGELPLFHDADGRAMLDLTSASASKAYAEDELLAEHLRLLYVALTRARHECHVVWGRFNGCENSAARWLLEPPPSDLCGPGENAHALRAHGKDATDEQLRQTIATLAAELPHCFALEPLPAPEAPLYAPESQTSRLQPAHQFRGPIMRNWRVTSFSALTTGIDAEADHDGQARPRLDFSTLTGIHGFPRGKKAGICLHAIFETLDFSRPGNIEQHISHTLRQHGLHTPERHAAVLELVRRTLTAPLLPNSASLSSLAYASTMRELEFHLPCALLAPAQLSQFAGAGLHFEPHRGILKGFIDLVFEHAGRFYVLDWKSNQLGPDTSSYTPAAIHAEMTRHRYGLQWQLYTLALHRYLKTRISSYTPETHLGGAIYVFLRGLDHGDADSGIFRAAPDVTAIRQLELLFPKP